MPKDPHRPRISPWAEQFLAELPPISREQLQADSDASLERLKGHVQRHLEGLSPAERALVRRRFEHDDPKLRALEKKMERKLRRLPRDRSTQKY